MQHVYGHSGKYLSEAKMSPAQWVNCRADKLATAALIAAVKANEFISSIFPLEKVCVCTRPLGLPQVDTRGSRSMPS